MVLDPGGNLRLRPGLALLERAFPRQGHGHGRGCVDGCPEGERDVDRGDHARSPAAGGVTACQSRPVPTKHVLPSGWVSSREYVLPSTVAVRVRTLPPSSRACATGCSWALSASPFSISW